MTLQKADYFGRFARGHLSEPATGNPHRFTKPLDGEIIVLR